MCQHANESCTARLCEGRCPRRAAGPPVLVAGAGLVGALLALMLGRRGYPVTVVEKRPDLRQTYRKDHRSINLALSHRGWQALSSVGLADAVRGIALPMYGRMIHPVAGALRFLPYGKEGEAIYSVSRNKLNELLLDQVDREPNVSVRFGHEVRAVDFDAPACRIADPDGLESTIRPAVVFGADGVFSVIRRTMQEKRLTQCEPVVMAPHYKELTIPAGPGGTWRLDPAALHIWPRGRFMMIALPNQDRTFTCTLFLPHEGDVSFEALRGPGAPQAFFAQYFPDALPLMPDLAAEFERNPVSRIVAVRCASWQYAGKVSLIGDAAHAIVPFYGQGMNAGFEDCLALLDLIGTAGQTDWTTVLPAFQRLRQENTDAIAELSLRNFIEMRDKVADPAFQLRQQIEAHLHQHFPDHWTPLYSLVSFSSTPYAEVLRISRRQDQVMGRIMALRGIAATWQGLDYRRILQRSLRIRELAG